LKKQITIFNCNFRNHCNCSENVYVPFNVVPENLFQGTKLLKPFVAGLMARPDNTISFPLSWRATEHLFWKIGNCWLSSIGIINLCSLLGLQELALDGRAKHLDVWEPTLEGSMDPDNKTGLDANAYLIPHSWFFEFKGIPGAIVWLSIWNLEISSIY